MIILGPVIDICTGGYDIPTFTTREIDSLGMSNSTVEAALSDEQK